METEWEQVRLGDLIDLKGGLSYKGNLITSQGTPMVTMGCVDPSRRFKEDGLKFYSGEFKETHTAIAGDIVIATRDVTQDRVVIGCPCLLPKINGHDRYVVATNTYRLINQSDVANEFLYLILKSQSYRNQIIASAKGSTVIMITKDSILDFSFSLPPKGERDSIVNVLGTLDDKIELNKKTNETLEGIAKALFKSWFVDFDPVRARAEGRSTGLPDEISELFPSSFEDSELGEIPSGWKVSTLGQENEIVMGQSPPGHTYNEEGNGLPFYQGRSDFGFRHPGERVYCSEPSRLAKEGSTLMSVRAPVGSINMVDRTCCIGRGVASIRSDRDNHAYAYYLMDSIQDLFDTYNSEGTVFGAINKKDLSAIEVVQASEDLEQVFEQFAAKIDRRISLTVAESASLTSLRDALLPRLISGELRVPDAEKMLEEVGI